MELVDYYISLLREETENQVSLDASGDIVRGISDELILSWINVALSMISKKLSASGLGALLERKTYDLSNGAITLDNRAIGGGSILKVEYEISSGVWRKLGRIDSASPDGTYITGFYPNRYEIFGRTISVWPTTTTGNVRVTYRKLLYYIDKRRGLIETITKNGAETHIQSITLANDSNLDAPILSTRSAITAVDSTGATTGREMFYSSYSSGSRIVTMNPEWEIGTSSIAVGNYVVGGGNATSHFCTTDEIRECALQYAKAKILRKDSDANADAEFSLFAEMLGSIIESYQETTEDYEFLDEDSNIETIL